ncbi:MAG: sigma-70 family RNA polymerase sigma factor [Planctomycetaceae bacterium]|nr:sigma-70 family RNA polymerase sigma factor [Planctomycetaceae bacterium]
MSDPVNSVMARVASGDPAAMEDCLARYGGLVWSLARRFSPTNADAEDAVQEVFIEVWRHAQRYDESIASEPTFIAMIARRRLIDRQRRRDRQPQTTAWDDATLPQTARDPAEWLQVCDDANRAREKMQELSSEQQRVLKLALEGGCSQSEIAERLQLPLGTVKTHARRGLIKLRELLAANADKLTGKGGVA